MQTNSFCHDCETAILANQEHENDFGLPESALMKFGLSRTLIILGAITLHSGPAAAEMAAFDAPVNVVFDTDVCLDIEAQWPYRV